MVARSSLRPAPLLMCVMMSLAAMAAPVRAQTPFLAGPATALTGKPTSLLAADFTADGRTDVSVLLSPVLIPQAQLQIRAATGFGSFLPIGAQPSLVITPSDALAVACTLNGDGTPDFVMSSTNYVPQSAFSKFVSTAPGPVYAGPITSFAPGTYGVVPIRALAAADLDGDGVADIAAIFGTAAGTELRVLKSTAAGGLAPFASYLAASNVNSFGVVALADVTGDGLPDLIYGINGQGLFYRANLAGTAFGPQVTITLVSSPFNDILVRDLNGDGKNDVIAAMAAGTFIGSAAFVLTQTNPGQFAQAGAALYSGPVGGAFQKIAVLDFDRDGRLDVAIACGAGHEVEFFTGNGDGTINFPGTALVLPGSVDLIVALNADSDLDEDLVVADRVNFTMTVLTNTTTLAVVGTPQVGTAFGLHLDDGLAPGLPYLLAAASSTTPPTLLPDLRPVPLAVFVAPGVIDPLFTLSTTPGGYGVFLNFSGNLDLYGRAQASVGVPPLPALAGVQIAFTYVTFNSSASSGIQTIGTAQLVTIAP